VQQDVLRLDIAVDHPVLVGILERAGHVGRDAHRVLHAELRLAVELRPQRLAVDERHHIIEETVGGAGIEEGQDVRMLQ
jgi:hypothetical protein